MIDLDRELAEKAFTARERVAIRLLLMLVYMVYPGKYGHQFDKFFELIKQDLQK